MFNPMTDRWENEGGKWMLDSSLMFTLKLHDADCPVPERAMSAIHKSMVCKPTGEFRPPRDLLPWEKGAFPRDPSRYETEFSI